MLIAVIVGLPHGLKNVENGLFLAHSLENLEMASF